MDTKSFVIGIILIGLGLLFLADNMGWFYLSWETFWPWLMVIGGFLFFVGWLKNRKDYGLLMPATILITYGLLFWYCAEYGWWHMGESRLWSFFMIGPGLGFLAMYLFGERDKGFLVPSIILVGLGLVFLTGPGNFRYIWPLVLILIGIRLLFKNRQKEQETAITEVDSKAPEPRRKRKSE